jgi:hypothetical protein
MSKVLNFSIVCLLLLGCDKDGDDTGGLAEVDADGDGYPEDEDCNDQDAAVYPDADEACNGIDDDCDGDIDEGVTETFYLDDDGDGFGAAEAYQSCDLTTGSGYVDNGDDCDDSSAEVYPGAEEVCDSVDNDCDDDIDEGLDSTTWYVDADADGYGNAEESVEVCADPGDGYSEESGDCDDEVATVNPGATEVCGNGLDDDCDGTANGCGLEGNIDLDSGIWITGSDAGHAAGGSVAIVPDVNGDGFDEVLVGAYGVDSVGAAYLVLGPVTADLSTADADLVILGTESGGALGLSVDGAGDVDGDGAGDFIISAHAINGAGEVYLFLGVSGGSLSPSDADATFSSSTSNHAWGYSIAGAGDLDADGFDDIAIGTWESSFAEEAAFIYKGPVTGALGEDDAWVRVVGEIAGSSPSSNPAVAPAGDLDGDGAADLAYGAHYQSTDGVKGAAYVVSSPSSGTLDLGDATAIIRGQKSSGQFGLNVAGAGDLDGDGYDDLLVGTATDGPGGEGAVYVFAGPVTGTLLAGIDEVGRVIGSFSSDYAGRGICGGADHDGDGIDDFMVGAAYADPVGSNSGQAWLVTDTVSGTMYLDDIAHAVFDGPNEGDYLGWDLACSGDTDGDGSPDVLISMTGDDTGGESAGAAVLFAGLRW